MKRGVRIPDRLKITADTPLSLDVAARMAFPDGSISGLALRNAARRGDLGHAPLGGRIYTTLADIERMVAARWVPPKFRPTPSPQLRPEGGAAADETGAAMAGALRLIDEMRQQMPRKKPR